MPRRLPTLLPLTLAVTVGLFALTSALTAQPPASPAAPGTGTDDPAGTIKSGQEENFKLYKKFAESLLRLAQKWEKGTPEEKAKAETIRAALKKAEEKGIDKLFREVVEGVSKVQNPTTPEFRRLLDEDAQLIAALKEILETLDTRNEREKVKKEIATLEEQIKQAKDLLRAQELLRARTENPRGDPNKIAKDQGDLADKTQKLADKIGGKETPDKPAGKGGDQPKEDKSEEKAQAKPGDSPAEPKPDTQDPGKDSGKDGAGDPKDGAADQKPGPKDGMDQDSPGASKPSPKDGAGDPKAGSSKPMGGEPKNKPSDGMGEPKPNPKGTDPAGMNPMGAKPSPAESKPQGDGKGMTKPSDGKGGDAKPMNSPMAGSPMSGSPSASKPSPSSPMSGSPMSGSPMSPMSGGPMPPSPNTPPNPAQKNLEEAVPQQKGAEKDLTKNDRPEASKKEDKAIEAIKRTLEELEKKLKQLREKEMAKKLADLESRVKEMLRLQKEVLTATEQLDGKVQANRGMLTDLDRRNSLDQADKENGIVGLANGALGLLQGEGSAVVFAGVLEEVRKDMEAIREQLQNAQMGEETQLVEKQVIAQLERMLKALEKAQQDLKPPPPPPPGSPPPPQDPGKKDLIKLVEQLKLLRDLQVQVNERTSAFGKRTPGVQATDRFVGDQLKLLGERQRILQEMLQKIAQGDQ